MMTHSIRFKFIVFLLVTLSLLLLLLNTYPIVSSRDTVFQEKRSSMSGQASVVVRPSGTEPKLKVYISVSAQDRAQAQAEEQKLSDALSVFFA